MKQILIGILLAAEVLSAARVVISVRPGHPIRRSLSRTVVVRPARRVVVTRRPIVYLPPVIWAAPVVAIPPRNRVLFEDSETIRRNEGWVDTNFGVDNRGESLLMNIEGQARLDFAEVTFENGQVQVVDFNERVEKSGTYRLLDFADGRRVNDVRIVAKAESAKARITIYMSK